MVSSKTCFILGAGASRPYKLPTSRELRHILIGEPHSVLTFEKLGRSHTDAVDAVIQYHSILANDFGFTGQEIELFRAEFFNSQRVSIDAFLAQHKERFEAIGKAAIASALLLCENSNHLNEDWYQWLLESILEDGPEFDPFSVITFNYDRSLEYFLWRAFRSSFPISDEEADRMLARIEIIHVYGHIGRIRETRSEDPVVPYGDIQQARHAVATIQVVAPRSLPVTTMRVRQILEQSNAVFFLGFGFWKENLDLLDFDASGKKVFASGYGLSPSDRLTALSRCGPPRKTPPVISFGAQDQDILTFLTHHTAF